MTEYDYTDSQDAGDDGGDLVAFAERLEQQESINGHHREPGDETEHDDLEDFDWGDVVLETRQDKFGRRYATIDVRKLRPDQDAEKIARYAIDVEEFRDVVWWGGDKPCMTGMTFSDFQIFEADSWLTRPTAEATAAAQAEAQGRVEKFKFKELRLRHPMLRPVVVDGLVRQGETVNIISGSKVGKSWLVYSLALCIIVGRMWLGRFPTTKGKVIIVDNELHRETLAYRIPQVAAALGITSAEYEDQLEIWPLRGNLRGLMEMYGDFAEIPHGSVQAIIFDAKYRFATDDENSNSNETKFYNDMDRVAEMTGAANILIHHSSKGTQGEKRVTDVGAGAGAQSRAADDHIVLREHEEPDCAVLEAAVRSFKPVEPIGLRWTFPIWTPTDDLDVTALKGRKSPTEERRSDDDRDGMQKILDSLADGGVTARALRGKTGLSRARLERLLDILESAGRVTWTETKTRGGPAREYTRCD